MFQVRDIMTDRFIAAGPETTIDDAISLILEHRISGLPVAGPGGELLGVITEIDIINLVYEADIETSRVGDHMTTAVQTLDADASLDEAASRFSSSSVRRFPVVSDGKLVGIISRRDLIRFVRETRKEAAAAGNDE